MPCGGGASLSFSMFLFFEPDKSNDERLAFQAGHVVSSDLPDGGGVAISRAMPNA
jgi:hypothetical protein